jgi:hypothetical protein
MYPVPYKWEVFLLSNPRVNLHQIRAEYIIRFLRATGVKVLKFTCANTLSRSTMHLHAEVCMSG